MQKTSWWMGLSWCGIAAIASAQDPGPAGAQDPGRRPGRGGPRAEQPTGSLDESWLKEVDWRSIGPANMMGRIVDIEVCATDSSLWYVATASGGLLKSTDGGISFEHLFDHEATVSLGDVCISRSDPNVVWVGTGENNPRNSVSYGDGVYKSVDGGKTWKNMGLKDTFQIGRIVIHPTDPNIVYVGALGRLYGPNEDRGLYKTTDGGENWTKIHFVDDKTGVIDVDMNPSDPQTLIVATYERQRDGFDGNDPAKKNGPGSGLYRTRDGGASFEKLSQGLPTRNLGRIGVDWSVQDPGHVYAVVESDLTSFQNESAGNPGFQTQDAEVGARVTEVEENGAAAAAGLKVGDIVLSANGTMVLSSRKLMEQVRRQEAGKTLELSFARDGEPQTATLTLGTYPKPQEESEDAPQQRGRGQANPFDSGLGGQTENLQEQQGEHGFEHGGLFRSEDGGTTWTRINSLNPRPMYYSQVRIDPSDEQQQWVLGTSLYRSEDRGASFRDVTGRGVHVDNHAMWIDPADGRHVLLGCDGGLYETRDRGANWRHHNQMAIGQFYHVEVGPRRNYMVYGGLQDNGSWGTGHRSRSGQGPINEDWLNIGGGDGFVCRVDVNDPDVVFSESQNGAISWRNLLTGERGSARPRAPEGVRYRFNWKTPYILSSHNSRIFYSAGNYVFRSLDRGADLEAISPEITLTAEGSGSELAESPRDAKVLYAGTTDGALWRTKDGGHEWTDLLAWHQESLAESAAAETPAGGEEAGATATGGPGPNAQEQQSSGEEPPAQDPRAGGRRGRRGGNGENGENGEAAPAGKPLRELIPGPLWVTSLEASRYAPGRVYLALDGHRSDNDEPWIFVSEDFGDTWTSIRADLPRGSSRTLREDRENENLLYLGTEFGAWLSLDRGKSWQRFHGDTLPTVAVHEFAQHATSGEVVAATHGRSLWIADVTPLRQMNAEVLAAGNHLLRPNDVVLWTSAPRRGTDDVASFTGANPSNRAQVYYLLDGSARAVSAEVRDLEGKVVQTLEATSNAGLNHLEWNLQVQTTGEQPAPGGRGGFGGGGGGGFGGFRRGRTAPAGTYVVVLTVDGTSQEQRFALQADPEYPDYRYLAVEEELENEWRAAHADELRALEESGVENEFDD